jgi:hypothetical protein
MKFLPILLSFVALSSLHHTTARVLSPASHPATAPAQQAPIIPQQQPPVVQSQTFEQLHNKILARKDTAAIIDAAKTRLQTSFIQDISTQVKTMFPHSKASQQQSLKMLLQTARDSFAPFTGNDTNDLLILQEMNTQIAAALNAL